MRSRRVARALSAEVDAGSAQESALKQRLRAVLDCNAIGHGSGPVRGGRSARQPLVILLAALAALPVSRPGRAAAEAQAVLDRPTDRQALTAALRARILASDSATLALEGWCAEHKLAADPHLVAQRLPGSDKPLTAAQRARLAIGPDEPVRYRRVRLVCGDRVMSEADNWYVPARLTPEMNAVLDGTHTPFGRVVRPLAPVRRTVEVRAHSSEAAPHPDDALFEVDAVLTTGAGQPFCEVVETYLGTALPSGSR
jgi:chorismate-pyruvate lyase